MKTISRTNKPPCAVLHMATWAASALASAAFAATLPTIATFGLANGSNPYARSFFRHL